jgi:hypothetical protein
VALLIDVTTFPQSFAAGTYPLSALNTGRFQITISVAAASSNATTFPDGNFWAIMVANDDGGLWFFKVAGTMFIGYFNRTGGATIWQRAIVWAANTPFTIDVDHVASTHTVTNASSGNGTTAFSAGGALGYSNTTLGVGVYGGGGFTWAGTASDVTDGVTGYTIVGETGAVPIAGAAAGLLFGHVAGADAGAVPIAGVAAGLLVGRRIAADLGAVALAGLDADLIFGSEDPYLQAEVGAVGIGGGAAELRAARQLAAESGGLPIAAPDASLSRGRPLAAEAGALALSGAAADLRAARQLAAEVGSVPIAAPDAALAIGTALEVGAAGVDFQIFGLANRDASVTLDTQPTGSLVIVASGGQTSDVTQGVTDSNANEWNRRGLVGYPDFAGYGVVVETTRPPMTGSDDHEFVVPVELFDENTTIAIEVRGGGRVAAQSWRNVANSSGAASLTSDPVTVDRTSILVAFWFGSSPVFSPPTTPFQANPPPGWTVGPSYLVNNANGEVQAASAWRTVGPGTWDIAWGQFPNQGAQLPLFAIQAAAVLVADPGVVPIGAPDASLGRGRQLVAEPESIDIAGQPAELRLGLTMAAELGSVPVVGLDAGEAVGRRLAAEVGGVGIGGGDAALAVGRRLVAEAGSAPILAPDLALLVGRRSAAEAGAVPLVGVEADLIWSGAGANFPLDAEPGAVPLGAPDATLARSWLLHAELGAMPIDGAPATLVRSGLVAWSRAAGALEPARRIIGTLIAEET